MTSPLVRGATTQGSAPTLLRCQVGSTLSDPNALYTRHRLVLTFHVFAPLAGAVASLRQLAAWGPANIEQYIAPLIERAAERAMALGMNVPPRAARSDHMIGKHKHTHSLLLRLLDNLLHPGVRMTEESGVTEDDLQAIAAELLAKGIHVSIRGTAIRISPNVCVLLFI